MALRLGVIGSGYLGTRHAEKLAAMRQVKLVGVHDVLPRRAYELAERLGCCAFSDPDLLLMAVDAVVVAVPAVHHAEVSLRALRTGRAVFVEKPIATSIAAAEQMVSLARHVGQVLQVGHIERFNPAFEAVAPLITHPAFMEVHRLSPFGERGLDSDVVMEVMIHDLDLVQALVGEPVVSVEAAGAPVLSTHLDIANARLTFAGGCVANITASRVSFQRMRKIRVFQPGEYLSVDLDTREVARVIRRGGEDDTVLEASGIPVASGDALENELQDFVMTIESGQEPRVGGEDGLRALKLAAQVLKSLREGRR